MADLKIILPFVATAFSGLYAGSSIFITAVCFPAIRNIKNTETARVCWKGLYLRGTNFQSGLVAIVAIAGTTLYFLEEGVFWIASCLLILSVFPYSFAVMIPTYKFLYDDDIVKKEGAEAVRRRLETWNKQQAVRTGLAVFVFGLILCHEHGII